MSETTLFNKSGIDQGASDIQAVSLAMNNELDELKGFLASKIASWEGPAREAYSQAQGQWDTSFTHMQTVLAKASATVTTVGENYQTAEGANQSIW